MHSLLLSINTHLASYLHLGTSTISNLQKHKNMRESITKCNVCY